MIDIQFTVLEKKWFSYLINLKFNQFTLFKIYLYKFKLTIYVIALNLVIENMLTVEYSVKDIF